MTLLIVCPYWRTLLAQAARGTFSELWRAAPAIEDAFLDETSPRTTTTAACVRTAPTSPIRGGAIRTLHRAVTVLDQDVIVRAPDRSACAPLHGPGARQPDHPRPTNGILVAITVMNSTLASSGRLAM